MWSNLCVGQCCKVEWRNNVVAFRFPCVFYIRSRTKCTEGFSFTLTCLDKAVVHGPLTHMIGPALMTSLGLGKEVCGCKIEGNMVNNPMLYTHSQLNTYLVLKGEPINYILFNNTETKYSTAYCIHWFNNIQKHNSINSRSKFY